MIKYLNTILTIIAMSWIITGVYIISQALDGKTNDQGMGIGMLFTVWGIAGLIAISVTKIKNTL